MLLTNNLRSYIFDFTFPFQTIVEGKTILATALYDQISYQFDTWFFIDDVYEIYGGYGPIGVQK